jgi:hypothetical protein
MESSDYALSDSFKWKFYVSCDSRRDAVIMMLCLDLSPESDFVLLLSMVVTSYPVLLLVPALSLFLQSKGQPVKNYHHQVKPVTDFYIGAYRKPLYPQLHFQNKFRSMPLLVWGGGA